MMCTIYLQGMGGEPDLSIKSFKEEKQTKVQKAFSVLNPIFQFDRSLASTPSHTCPNKKYFMSNLKDLCHDHSMYVQLKTHSCPVLRLDCSIYRW